MWNVVLLFLGLMKAVSYVAGSGTTVDEKSGTLALRTSCVLLRQLLRSKHKITCIISVAPLINRPRPLSFYLPCNELDLLHEFRIHDAKCKILNPTDCPDFIY